MRVIGFDRCCWRPLWNSSGIEAPATGPPTGSVWARPGDEDEWTVNIGRANRSRRCGSILSTSDSARSSRGKDLHEERAGLLRPFRAGGGTSSANRATPANRQRLGPPGRGLDLLLSGSPIGPG